MKSERVREKVVLHVAELDKCKYAEYRNWRMKTQVDCLKQIYRTCPEGNPTSTYFNSHVLFLFRYIDLFPARIDGEFKELYI